MAPAFLADRLDAGHRLGVAVGATLATLADVHEPIVVGLPRGGVPVAAAVAHAIGAPVDVLLVRKVGVPSHRELAMGAIGEDDVVVVNDEVVRAHGITSEAFDAIVREERAELAERSRRFRGGHHAASLTGRCVVVVDDGLATGATARAACTVARMRGAAAVVLAVPVAPQGWERGLGDAADRYVALATPSPFGAVGAHYVDFHEVSDAEVLAALVR